MTKFHVVFLRDPVTITHNEYDLVINVPGLGQIPSRASHVRWLVILTLETATTMMKHWNFLAVLKWLEIRVLLGRSCYRKLKARGAPVSKQQADFYLLTLSARCSHMFLMALFNFQDLSASNESC